MRRKVIRMVLCEHTAIGGLKNNIVYILSYQQQQ